MCAYFRLANCLFAVLRNQLAVKIHCNPKFILIVQTIKKTKELVSYNLFSMSKMEEYFICIGLILFDTRF